jgi:hypothetical protein
LEIICRSCTCVHRNSKCGQLFHNCPSGKTLPKLNKLNSQVNCNRREKPKRSIKTTILSKNTIKMLNPVKQRRQCDRKI